LEESAFEIRARRRAVDRARRRRRMWMQRAAAAALAALAATAAVSLVRGAPGRRAPPLAAAPARHDRAAHGAVPAAPVEVRGRAARRLAVPILTYHVVGTPAAGTPNERLWVGEHDFAVQMRALARAGYAAVTLRQAFDAWSGRGGFPRRPVVISFDDGYRDQFKNAFPVLRRLGWPGVLNLELRNLGPAGITPREVERLLAAGWELDSHTLTHPDLTAVTGPQLHREVSGSRRELRRRFGAPVDFFCYPAGRYDDRVVAAVRAAGYEGATTTVEGYARRSQPFTLPRFEVRGGEPAASLLARLSG
jgi:peptidoglycan/xylan/chitin deacetylase (PgdA/CDA1 family)